MLFFDQLKKNDPQLQLLTLVVAAGLTILLVGLWWLQIVCAHEYEGHLVAQTYRTVRLAAMRGKILDRNGEVLAENQATYDICLYLEDLRPLFDKAYDQAVGRLLSARTNQIAQVERQLHRSLNRTERAKYRITTAEKNTLRGTVRYSVASNLVYQIGERLQQPLELDPAKFERHYSTSLVLPFPVVQNLTPAQVARFEEQSSETLGANLDIQNTRVYPHDSSAAHVLGYLRRDNNSVEGEDAYFSYRLPDYVGQVGVEGNFDQQLHGRAGVKSVLVNNLGYRQEEKIVNEADPGWNVVLTLDLEIQQGAERALLAHQGTAAKAAAVVMDVNTGDVLAMASSPTFDPNDFARGISSEKYHALQELEAEKNRATFENYAPGSIFKTVVGLAALENGLNPEEIYHVQANPADPGHGIIYVGRRAIKDTALPGDYDFKRAFIHSSNSYFITNGLRAGIQSIVRMGEKFHLGERTGLFARQETPGTFPSQNEIMHGWSASETANLSIGQGKIDVTPIQMAVLISAIANNGTVLWPRLVQRIEPQDPLSGESPTTFPAGQVRDHLEVRPHSLAVLRDAMLADVESVEGTGKRAAVPGLRICGKTGTAQVMDTKNVTVAHNYWFASYAPFEKPKYAVVVLVQSTAGGSGGDTCAPIAHDIYAEIQKLEATNRAKAVAMKN